MTLAWPAGEFPSDKGKAARGATVANVDKCTYIINCSSLFTIPEFAALWCGVPKNKLADILLDSQPSSQSAQGSQMLINKDYPCLYPRCLFICTAIREKRLITYNDLGEQNLPESKDFHCAWNRMRLRPDKVIEWLQETDMPIDELPHFIYDDPKKNNDELNAKKETSYKIIIYSLLKKIGKDPFPRDDKGNFALNRNLTTWVKQVIELAGFSMDDDTIRGILQGLQHIEQKRKPK